jgi:uncharacterized membrane protein YkvA (DUF1232 family)
VFEQLKSWAKKLKKQIFILYLAYKDKRVTWYAKLFTACVVGYAFSPIDLIPDFIPILGYLDDIIIVPFGIMLALKMLPKSVITECTIKAEQMMKSSKPKNWIVGTLIIILWCSLFVWIVTEFFQFF